MVSVTAQLFIDLEKWETELNSIRYDIELGENLNDPDYFISARKRIAGVLDDIEGTRQFLKRHQQVEQLTAGVETLFSPDQPAMPFDGPPEDLRLRDEDRSE